MSPCSGLEPCIWSGRLICSETPLLRPQPTEDARGEQSVDQTVEGGASNAMLHRFHVPHGVGEVGKAVGHEADATDNPEDLEIVGAGGERAAREVAGEEADQLMQ